MCSVKTMRWGPVLLAIALLFFAPPAQSAITPESDVLLPWFEIDLERADAGLSTTFTVVNASVKPARTRFTVYTNWGIPVLEVPMDFQRAEAKTIDLHAWIAHGQLPGRTLEPAELAALHAKLTGRQSPVDGLFYGTPSMNGRAVGYVIVQTLDDRPDSLWGDTYSVDAATNYFQAETLTALSHGLQADCNRHGVRFINEGGLYEGDELIIWSGRRFEPSPTPVPGGAKMKITVAVYDQAGHHVQDCHRELIAVEPIEICHLDITPPIGWLDIRTEDPTYILEHLHSTTQASAELHSYCLRADVELEGPSIAIEKKVNENEADNPTGPKYDAGDAIEFEYYVTNTGTVALTAITVTDDAGLTVTCPKSTLAAGETMICRAETLAAGCLNGNIGTATGTAPDGTRVTATDSAYYTGLYKPAVTLELLVNDAEADDPPGPYVEAGDTLHYTYVVTNSGNAKLLDVAVADRKGNAAVCPKSELNPGESMTCSAEGIAGEGQTHEVGHVSATDECYIAVVATDPAYSFGRRRAPSIDIHKYAGENDADVPPGPSYPVGTTITWRFVVTNTGNVPLSNVSVTDSSGITPQCPKTALDPGESMLCTATSVALPCQQSNTATASGIAGEGEQGQAVTATDKAHYTGEVHPAITLELKLNGDPADVPPGAWFEENAPLTLTWEIANTGDVELTGIVAADDRDRTATCPKTTLQPGESMICSAGGVAVAGTHDILGTVTARPPCGDPVNADDPVFYRGRALQAGIDIVKMTNGVHADTPPGPSVAIGSQILWSYVVTNTGNVPLSNVTVSDDGGVTPQCPKTALEPGESMTCTASGTAQACQYSNTATANGTPSNGEPVAAADHGYYFGQHHASITIDKKANGHDTLEAITTGAAITWTFVVTNTGDVTLTGVSVTDDRTTAVTCPKTSLMAGESMTCTAAGTAVAGPQRNVATVAGKPPCGNDVTATDACNYTGVTPGINIEKLINGQDADDAAHAVHAATGATLVWSFVVTNTGDVTLSDISVTDDNLTAITCPGTTLAPGASMTCTASGTAFAGLDCDTARAAGTSPQSVVVESTDSACYIGETSSIAIEKRTNGQDADTPPGPTVATGSLVAWAYVVTNTGSTLLTNVTVTDDRGVTVTCPKTTLQPSESMTCTASGTAVEGQYSNIGTASGTPPSGGAVTASDPSHYYGAVTGDQGCTPGYWKNHTDSWPPTAYSPTQTVVSVFSEASRYPAQGATSLLGALGFAGGAGNEGAAEILLRAGVAALLNAAHPGVAYPRLTANVIADVNTALTSNRDAMLALAAALDADNNRGCPLN